MFRGMMSFNADPTCDRAKGLACNDQFAQSEGFRTDTTSPELVGHSLSDPRIRSAM